MNNTKRFYGILIIIGTLVLMLAAAYMLIKPMYMSGVDAQAMIVQKSQQRDKLQKDVNSIKDKINRAKGQYAASKKRIYAPIESDLGDDTLFFNLYNDLLEMLHANSIRVKSINYNYNPENDNFAVYGGGKYFVFQIDLELVSNYESLGKLIEGIYSYPYYIKINSIDVRPYEKDRKILNTKLSLTLYSKTTPDDDNIPM